jgi:hypothetical protein
LPYAILAWEVMPVIHMATKTSPTLTPCISHILFEGQFPSSFHWQWYISSQHPSVSKKSISIGNQGYCSFFCGLSFSLHDWV